MDRLARLFFEDPLYVYVTLAFAELALAAVWHERRDRRLALLLVVPPLLAGIAFLVSWQVVTDRERIVTSTREIARDLEAGRLDAAERYLASDYSGLGGDKRGALAAASSTIRTYQIDGINLTRVNVTVDGPVAAMQARTMIDVRGAGRMSADWQVRWAKRPEGWRIVHLQLPESRLGL